MKQDNYQPEIRWLKYWLLVLLCSASIPFLLSSETAPAVPAGVIRIGSLNRRIYLADGWLYKKGDNPQYATLDYDDRDWTTISFPQMDFDNTSEAGYHVWFRHYFFISKELTGIPLGYSAGKLPETAEIYFNGYFIGRHGSLPPAHYYGNPTIPKSFVLSDGLVHYGGLNCIAIRTYTEQGSMNLVVPYLSSVADKMDFISREFFINAVVPLVTLFLSAIVAIYALIMSIRNREEKYNLFLFIAQTAICVFCTLLSFEYLPFPVMLMNKIQYSSLFIANLFFIYYFQAFFQIQLQLKLKLILAAITAISCMVIFSAPTFQLTMFLIYRIFYFFVLIPGNFYILLLTILAVSRRQRYARVLLAGISCCLLTIFHDITFVSIIRAEPNYWLFTSGMFVLILSLFVAAANRFVDTKQVVDKLNIDLIQQKDAFFRFVPTQFLSLLGKNSAVDISLGDSSQHSMSVLFSDLRKFSLLAEGMNPEASFRLLNRYLLRMENSIMQHDGFVDKYFGDAIMALFSEIPGSDEKRTSADRAVLAAIQMRGQLAEFNRHQQQQNLKSLSMGIGINTGPLMLGTVGSSSRLDTTVIGDSVKLASTLERLTDYFQAGILISEYTLQQLSAPDGLLLRTIDHILVKGSVEPLAIYEIFNSDRDELMDQKRSTREELLEGITYFRSGKFEVAARLFRDIQGRSPVDPLPGIYLKRCSEYLKNPPPPDWNGGCCLPESILN